MSPTPDFGLLWLPFLAGLLVLATHVPLGAQVLARGIVFIDLSIAQIAGLGVIAAVRLGFEPSGWAVQLAAVSAALMGALLFTFSERRWPELQEALIGTVFVLAASGGTLLLAGHPHGGEQLQELLAGQILWVSPSHLSQMAMITAILLFAWLHWRGSPSRLGFHVLFACAVTASVQLVGVYLVFASLIIPAIATRNFQRWRLAIAYLLGGSGYALGLALSLWLDLPSGSIIVWALAVLAIISCWFGAKSGKSLLSKQGKAT